MVAYLCLLGYAYILADNAILIPVQVGKLAITAIELKSDFALARSVADNHFYMGVFEASGQRNTGS